jgi:hypothetical protein
MTDTRRQQRHELRDDLEELHHERQSLQIRLYDHWSQVQWRKVHKNADTVASASLAADIATLRAKQAVIREGIRELKERIRELQATR